MSDFAKNYRKPIHEFIFRRFDGESAVRSYEAYHSRAYRDLEDWDLTIFNFMPLIGITVRRHVFESDWEFLDDVISSLIYKLITLIELKLPVDPFQVVIKYFLISLKYEAFNEIRSHNSYFHIDYDSTNGSIYGHVVNMADVEKKIYLERITSRLINYIKRRIKSRFTKEGVDAGLSYLNLILRDEEIDPHLLHIHFGVKDYRLIVNYIDILLRTFLYNFREFELPFNITMDDFLIDDKVFAIEHTHEA